MREMELSGDWVLRKVGGGKAYRATVPGCVHTDLLAAGEIEDPYYRDNEGRLQWIGRADWIYSRDFDVSPDFLSHDRVVLRCEMLDTLAVVRINGRLAGRTDNMFRTWEFDARKLLKAGRNKIEVEFASPLPYITNREKVSRIPLGKAFGGYPSGWIRKEPCNFGWDWGPVLITCGIQRPIRLVGFNVARVTDVRVNQTHAAGTATLDIEVAVDGRERGLAVSVGLWLKSALKGQVMVPVSNGRGRARLKVVNPSLWWPAGMGGQPLYEVTADLLDASGHLLDTETKRIGLRTLRVSRKKDRWGESFTFTANGTPFFAKGANWIPADTFQSRTTAAVYRRLVEDARTANINMLRVWGGGVYEEDSFYDICDELGIVIWQDFMFACNAYPAFDRAFMDNVRAEVADNVKRLRHHPCIGLWCGNNELEMLNVADKWRPSHMSWTDYGKLFDDLIPDELRKHDSERDYWPSSPHTPRGDRKKHWDPASGDAHLWDVWHGAKPFEAYRGHYHRFVSEFGFQSFTEPKTTRDYTVPADRNVTSRIMEHHQRSGTYANGLIIHYMLSWFRLPLGFENTLWLSQILQGLAIKYAVEHWRRNVPRCMGAVYWQLNDCWPVASWASIDYPGRWKALHFAARSFFAPLMISGVERPKEGEVDVHVASDLGESARCSVRWTLTDVSGKRLAAGRKNVRVAARRSAKVATISAKKLVESRGAGNVLVWLELVSEGEVVSRNLVLFARPKHMELEDPGITKSVKRLAAGYEVTLKVKRPALWAWVELKGAEARYSDNFIHLRPGLPVRLMVTPERRMKPAEFSRRLAVKSLINTY